MYVVRFTVVDWHVTYIAPVRMARTENCKQTVPHTAFLNEVTGRWILGTSNGASKLYTRKFSSACVDAGSVREYVNIYWGLLLQINKNRFLFKAHSFVLFYFLTQIRLFLHRLDTFNAGAYKHRPTYILN